MREHILNKKKIAYILMTVLVLIWGFEFVCAKLMLDIFKPITLIFVRFSLALIVITIIKLKIEPGFQLKKKDIKLFFLCAFIGQVLYLICEWTALDYLPVSIVSLTLAFTPVISILIEKVLYGISISLKMLFFIAVSIVGVSLIIGIDVTQLLGGKIFGYLFCLGAIICVNIYNYLTSHLGKNYSDISLSINQVICTVLLTLPYAVTHLPNFQAIDISVVGAIAFMGLISAGFGFYIYIFGISNIGPTANAVYMNFQPVSTTFFCWLILGESMNPIQLLGGALVIVSGIIVLKEKGKIDTRNEIFTSNEDIN